MSLSNHFLIFNLVPVQTFYIWVISIKAKEILISLHLITPFITGEIITDAACAWFVVPESKP
jgi:hypothetical protein